MIGILKSSAITASASYAKGILSSNIFNWSSLPISVGKSRRSTIFPSIITTGLE